MSWRELYDDIDMTDVDSVYIFDIENTQYLAERKSTLIQLLDKGVTIGCVVNRQQKELTEILLNQVKCPVLSHPYSPRQLMRFFNILFDVNNALVKDKKAVSENVLFQGHALLVEDNHVNQLVAGQMIANLGLTFDVVDNGQKAVDRIKRDYQYDIVFMDVQMPVMDGYAATRELRNLGFTDLIICGLSANALKEDIELANNAGMNDYLTKPIEAEDLIKICGKYLTT